MSDNNEKLLKAKQGLENFKLIAMGIRNVHLPPGITAAEYLEYNRINNMVIPRVEFQQEVRMAHERLGISGYLWNVMALVTLQEAVEKVGAITLRHKALKVEQRRKDLDLARRIKGSLSIIKEQ